MKTQINTLIKGDHRLGISGTNSLVRNDISKNVISENHEFMKISIRGVKISLKANYSISGKSVNYFGEIPLSLYNDFFGDFCLPKENPKAFVNIGGNMGVTFYTNSKKMAFQYIKEYEITIL